jgi:P-type Ca2+ transporter type 2C
MWHDKDLETVYLELDSSADGLSQNIAETRLAQYGPNELTAKAAKSPVAMILDQFKDFMIIVLIAAAVVAGFVGEVSDTIAIVVIVILNAAIGFFQEYRAEQAIAALKKMAAPFATVIRDGKPVSLPAKDLVPGDVVILEAGAIIPADLRLTEAARLKIEEAALTGESVPAEKDSSAVIAADSALGDRINMAFKGTFVTYGRGIGIVTATGHATELGKIADLIQGEEGVKTPLQKRLAVFGRNLAIIVLVICGIVFAMGTLRGEKPLLMLLTAISLAVAAIPEALPALVTVSLAIGARRLVKQNALIRTLPAVETLGSVTYICSDKTGTLTMNKMTAEEFYLDGEIINVAKADNLPEDESRLNALMEALALSNDAAKDKDGGVIGDPTETALYNLAGKFGFHKNELERTYPRVKELPFDSERKKMTTIHEWRDGKYVSLTKGAAESLISDADVLTVVDRMSADGLRVLAIGMRVWDALPGDLPHEAIETNLNILGLVGILDPPREEARQAVAECRRAGIHPVMITGDHPLTAKAIAMRLGILDDHRKIITGSELAAMSLEEFEQEVENIAVYARVAPEQKLKIVRALQDRGQYVAMTGDGVNDAPALKRADIGVAMGITGTDVAKEASHMILLDDNFSTIVKAIKEGRQIFDNIRKFIRYIMTSNAGEIWTIFLAPFFGLPIPLLPIHILWINLVTDGLPGLALAVEPPERDVMSRPPRHPKENIFAHGLGVDIVWVGLLIGVVCLFAQAIFINAGGAGKGHWQTMVFTVLCLSQMGNVLATRSDRDSFFAIGPLTNKPLIGAFLLTLALQLATIYVPVLNPIFRTKPLTLTELGITLALSSIVFVAVEVKKAVLRMVTSREVASSSPA